MSDSLDPGALAGPAAAAPPPANVSPLRGRAPAIVSADPYREENRPRMLEVYKQFKEEATDQRAAQFLINAVLHRIAPHRGQTCRRFLHSRATVESS